MIKRCVIITAFLDCELLKVYKKQEHDYIICADGGITIAEKSGIIPDIVLGDLDSVEEVGARYSFIRYPREKDDTDTLLCIKYGIKKGFKDFLIIGGIGGRLDHTIANIQALAFAKESGVNIAIVSGDAFCTMISDGGKYEVKKTENCCISLFSYTDVCEGVYVLGTKYELSDALLKNTFPLGVSNEFNSEKAEIRLSKGKLLIVVSKI